MAGIFVLGAFGGFLTFTVVVAFKQGWFTAQGHYKAIFPNGEGLRPGTLVQMAGLRAGAIDAVRLNSEDKIEVILGISKEFSHRIKKDSVVRTIRPFIIGDKILEVTVGSPDSPVVDENTELGTEESMDLMDLMGGGKLGPYLKTLDGLLHNLQIVVEAFTDPKRSQALIKMFDLALPTMEGLIELSDQATTDSNLKTAMGNISALTKEMKVLLPEIRSFAKNLPMLGDNTTKTMVELAKLTEAMNKYLPILAEIAPQMPEVSKTGIETLKEAVVVLKAMQKSFLLRGSVADVKEEEAEKKAKLELQKTGNQSEEELRTPATEK